MKDVRSDLGTVLKTGKVELGTKKVLSILLMDNPKVVLISANCPNEIKERVTYYAKLANVPSTVTGESSIELGSVCGKPFPVSVLAVMDEGDSDILSKFRKEA